MNIKSLVDVKTIGRGVPRRGMDFTHCEGNYILDERGEPVAEPDLFTWAEWLEEAYRTRSLHLADDSIGPYRVSTIFLGLDHQFGVGGPPVLWETIIFGTEEEFEIIPGKRRKCRKPVHVFRYTSKAEALEGHARAVKLAESLPHSLPAEPEGNGENCPGRSCPPRGDSG